MPTRLDADCSACVGLCCVALPFTRSADFPVNKPAGTPCQHLRPDHSCAIHSRLRKQGYVGCAAFDCFGAGQRVTAAFGAVTWRDSRDSATVMFATFAVVRQLHEMLRYLDEVANHPEAGALHDRARRLALAIDRAASLPPEQIETVDVAAQRAKVSPVLTQASELVRAAAPGTAADHSRADWAGRQQRGRNLRGASLRGACLIGTDLTGADLRDADFLGADLRGTILDDAHLDHALFLTQPQLTAAQGNAMTVLPSRFVRPAHWS